MKFIKKLLWYTLLITVVVSSIFVLSEDTDFPILEKIQEKYADSIVLSDAIEETPAPGLRITVPAAAINKKLKVVARWLSAPQILERNTFEPNVGPLIAAYEVSLGLLPEERLIKPMQISFNLQELGIPQDEWQNLRVYREEGSDVRIPINPKIEGNELKLLTTKNSVFTCFLAVTGGATALYYVNGLYSKGTLSYLAINSVMEDGTTYRLLWPESLKSDSKDLLNKIKARYLRLEKEIKRQLAEANITDSKAYLEKTIEIVQKQRNTEDYRDVENWVSKIVNSSGFPPYEVRQTEKALKDIHAFFTNVKGLPPKNVLGVDIVIRTGETWPHTSDPKAVAMSVNQRGAVLPYVDIHADNIQDKDELYLNLTHELFHVLQEDYYHVQGLRSAYYLSFLEGTAVLVEYEAAKYFSDPNLPGKARISKKANTTDRDYYITLSNPMEDNDAELTQRHHGYTMSHFLEFLRDHHAKDKEKYIAKLMASFGGTYSFSTNKALYRSVDMKPGDFSQAFIQYCSDNAKVMADSIPREKADEARNVGKEALFKDISQKISIEAPCFEWDYPVEKPLSCEFRFIDVQMPKDSDTKKIKLLINDENLRRQGVKLRFALNGNAQWQDYTSGGIAVDAANINKITLQRISPMVECSWLLSASGKSQIAIMYPPEAPVVEKLEGGKISIAIKESILGAKNLIKGYRICIKAPGSTELVVHNISKTESAQPYSLPDFERISTDPQLYKLPYEIYYMEIALPGGEKDEVTGPESKKISYSSVEDMLAAKFIGKCTYNSSTPESLKKAKDAQLEKIAQLSFAYMAQSGGNKDAVKNAENETAQSATKLPFQASTMEIAVHDKAGNYTIEAQLPGMTLKGFLQHAGMAGDKWATRYIVTDKKWNKLGFLDVMTREGSKPGQEALFLELNMSSSPDRFEMVVNNYAQYIGYFYKDGKKPKWKDSELVLKEIFP